MKWSKSDWLASNGSRSRPQPNPKMTKVKVSENQSKHSRHLRMSFELIIPIRTPFSRMGYPMQTQVLWKFYRSTQNHRTL